MDTLRTLSLALVCALLSTPALAASGPDNTALALKPGTYVVSETFVSAPNPDFAPFQASFTGRFTFNPNGTGLCSALLCAPGVIPDFPNVRMSGTATNGVPWGPSVDGQIGVEEVGAVLEFVNLNGFSALTSSTSFLNLTLTAPLGGSVFDIETSEADYCAFGSACANVTGTHMACESTVITNNATCSGSVDIVGHKGSNLEVVTRRVDSSVPEPDTFLLLSLALAGFAVRGIRGRSLDIAVQ